MKGLLYKEFLINRGQFVGVLIGCLVSTLIIFIMPNEVAEFASTIYGFAVILMFVLLFALIGMFQQGIFAPDERKKWASFVISTPMAEKGQVIAKYIVLLVSSLFISGWCLLCCFLIDKVKNIDLGLVKLVIGLFFLQLFMRSVETPFIIRYSSKYGNYFRMGIMYMIFFIVIVYLLFGDLSMFGDFERFMELFVKLARGENLSRILSIAATGGAILSVVMFILSCFISCKLYKNGVDYYDK